MKAKISGDKKQKILRTAYNKMMEYAKHATGEISGIGVEKENVIYDIAIFEQKCSTSDTELDMEDLVKYITKLANENPDKVEHMKVWWHSHSNMGCFWSSTDDDNIKNMMDNMKKLISIVVNKKGEFKTRIDLQFEDNILTLDELDLEIIENVNTQNHNSIKELCNDFLKVIKQNFPNQIKSIGFNVEKEKYSLEFNTDITEKESKKIKKEVKEKVKSNRNYSNTLSKSFEDQYITDYYQPTWSKKRSYKPTKKKLKTFYSPRLKADVIWNGSFLRIKKIGKSERFLDKNEIDIFEKEFPYYNKEQKKNKDACFRIIIPKELSNYLKDCDKIESKINAELWKGILQEYEIEEKILEYSNFIPVLEQMDNATKNELIRLIRKFKITTPKNMKKKKVDTLRLYTVNKFIDKICNILDLYGYELHEVLEDISFNKIVWDETVSKFKGA